MTAAAERAFWRGLRARDFQRVYYLHGEETYLRDAAVRELTAAATDAATRDFNLDSLDARAGAEPTAEMLGSLLATPPMMAERRVVVVRGVAALRKEALEVLERYLRTPAADLVLVLVAGGERAGSTGWGALERRLRELPGALEFARLDEERLPRWIAHHASSALGITIAPAAAELLAGAVGNDLPALAAELDKLASYTGGAEITEVAVGAVVGVRRGETLGDFLDAVAARDATRALTLLPHVLAQPKVTGVSLVMALTTQLLAFGWASAERERLGPGGGARVDYFAFLRAAGGAYAGRPWGEAARAWARTAERWDAAAVDAALEALLATDMALKETGLSSDEQLLATLVLSLCAGGTHRARSRPGRTRMALAFAAAVLGASALSAVVRPAPLAAQEAAAPTDTAFLRAQRLVAEGRGAAGRALVDTLLAAAPPGSARYAEALYWRAALAADAAGAERDYQRLLVEYPLSPRVDEVLLRLAQLELARGNRERALERLQRLERERPNSPARARASYWMARVYFDAGNAPAACARLEDARARAAVDDAELRNQVEYYAQRCLGVDTAAAPAAAAAAAPAPGAAASERAPAAAAEPSRAGQPPRDEQPPRGAPAGRAAATSEAPGYTVQVAAMGARADADRLARRLEARGYPARVVALGGLYRVRVGRYATHAAATAAATGMQAKGITVYVTEAEPR